MNHVIITDKERASRLSQSITIVKLKAIVVLIMMITYLLLAKESYSNIVWLYVDIFAVFVVCMFWIFFIIVYVVVEFFLPYLKKPAQSLIFDKDKEILYLNIPRGKDGKVKRRIKVAEIISIKATTTPHGTYDVLLKVTKGGKQQAILMEVDTGSIGVASFVYDIKNSMKKYEEGVPS